MDTRAGADFTGAVLAEVWPFFGLEVRTPGLVLRYPDDGLLAALASVAAAGVHDPATMPFTVPWTDAAPGGPLERGLLQYQWGRRAELGPERWALELAVVVDGEPVGIQAASSRDFPLLRTAETGSWLGRAHHGRGIGRRMRAAMLHLLFDGLGAAAVTSGAYEDNPASLAVSRATGYVDNGWRPVRQRDRAGRQRAFILERERWEGLLADGELPLRRDDVEFVGLDPCLDLLGLA